MFKLINLNIKNELLSTLDEAFIEEMASINKYQNEYLNHIERVDFFDNYREKLRKILEEERQRISKM